MKFCLLLTTTLLLFSLNDKRVNATVTVYDERNLTIIDYDDSAAAFGPRIPENGFKGYVVAADPIDGCTAIAPPPNVSFVNPSEWIALVKRTPGLYNNCSFDVKVHNAQVAGFKAVIVYNADSDTLITMSSSGKFSIKIPSIFVGYSTGNELQNEFTYKNGTYVIITSEDNDLSYLLIPFVCVVSICFIIAISIFLVKLALHCHKIRKNRFPRSALKKIPTKKYQKTDKYDTCPICLNEYEEGVKIRILPCEHAYHIECIDKWLLRNNRCCPVCKRRVIPGDPESDNEDSDTGPTRNATNSSIVEHEANEDEDTNESSRLLVNNRNQSDDQSICTTSTILNNQLNNNNEISSLNNQMTNSMNSAQLPNKELRSSSSKYGSISSINQLANSSSTNAYTNQSCVDIDIVVDETDPSKKIKIPLAQNLIDSKASPDDFHTPQSQASELTTDQGISSSPYTLNLDSKHFHLKKNENPPTQNKSKKSSVKSNSEFNENEVGKSSGKGKKAKNSKITPLNIKPNENVATTSSNITSQSNSTGVEDNGEHFESCKEDLNLMSDNVTLITPKSPEKDEIDDETMPKIV